MIALPVSWSSASSHFLKINIWWKNHCTNRCFVSEFEISSLHRDKLRLLLKQGGSAPGFYPDDATGEKEIYRIENFELAPVEANAHGMFFAGDSYVIKYTHEINGRQKFIVYFWQVLDSLICWRNTFWISETHVILAGNEQLARWKSCLSAPSDETG